MTRPTKRQVKALQDVLMGITENRSSDFDGPLTYSQIQDEAEYYPNPEQKVNDSINAVKDLIGDNSINLYQSKNSLDNLSFKSADGKLSDKWPQQGLQTLGKSLDYVKTAEPAKSKDATVAKGNYELYVQSLFVNNNSKPNVKEPYTYNATFRYRNDVPSNGGMRTKYVTSVNHEDGHVSHTQPISKDTAVKLFHAGGFEFPMDSELKKAANSHQPIIKGSDVNQHMLSVSGDVNTKHRVSYVNPKSIDKSRVPEVTVEKTGLDFDKQHLTRLNANFADYQRQTNQLNKPTFDSAPFPKDATYYDSLVKTEDKTHQPLPDQYANWQQTIQGDAQDEAFQNTHGLGEFGPNYTQTIDEPQPQGRRTQTLQRDKSSVAVDQHYGNVAHRPHVRRRQSSDDSHTKLLNNLKNLSNGNQQLGPADPTPKNDGPELN